MPDISLARIHAAILAEVRYAIQSGRASSVRQLAHCAALSQPALHNALSGKRRLSTAALDRLTIALDLDIAAITAALTAQRTETSIRPPSQGSTR